MKSLSESKSESLDAIRAACVTIVRNEVAIVRRQLVDEFQRNLFRVRADGDREKEEMMYL